MLLTFFRRVTQAILGFSLISCFDVFNHETAIYGPYYVADDPAGSYKTLYYRINEGLDAERFRNVAQVGYKAGYVFIKSQNRFYWFAVINDRPTDLNRPEIKNLISKPLTESEFNDLLSSLRIYKVDFQFRQ